MSRKNKIGAVGLIYCALLTSCTNHQINPNNAEVYYELWQEAEKELSQCVETSDAVAR